jgi:hypothetical protein
MASAMSLSGLNFNAAAARRLCLVAALGALTCDCADYWIAELKRCFSRDAKI